MLWPIHLLFAFAPIMSEALQNGPSLFKMRIEKADGKSYLVWTPLTKDRHRIKIFIVMYGSENDVRPNQIHGSPARFSRCPKVILRYPEQEFCAPLDILRPGTLYTLSVRYLLTDNQWGPDGGQISYGFPGLNRTTNRIPTIQPLTIDMDFPQPRSQPPTAHPYPSPLPRPQTDTQPQQQESWKALCRESIENPRVVRATTGEGDYFTWEVPVAHRDEVMDFRIYWQVVGASWWRENQGPKDSFRCPLGFNLPGYCYSLGSLPMDKQRFNLRVAAQLTNGHRCASTDEVVYSRTSGPSPTQTDGSQEAAYPGQAQQGGQQIGTSGLSPEGSPVVAYPGQAPPGVQPGMASPFGGMYPQTGMQPTFGINPAGMGDRKNGHGGMSPFGMYGGLGFGDSKSPPMIPTGKNAPMVPQTSKGKAPIPPQMVFSCQAHCDPLMAALNPFFGGMMPPLCFIQCGMHIVHSCLHYCMHPFGITPPICEDICVSPDDILVPDQDNDCDNGDFSPFGGFWGGSGGCQHICNPMMVLHAPMFMIPFHCQRSCHQMRMMMCLPMCQQKQIHPACIHVCQGGIGLMIGFEFSQQIFLMKLKMFLRLMDVFKEMMGDMFLDEDYNGCRVGGDDDDDVQRRIINPPEALDYKFRWKLPGNVTDSTKFVVHIHSKLNLTGTYSTYKCDGSVSTSMYICVDYADIEEVCTEERQPCYIWLSYKDKRGLVKQVRKTRFPPDPKDEKPNGDKRKNGSGFQQYHLGRGEDGEKHLFTWPKFEKYRKFNVVVWNTQPYEYYGSSERSADEECEPPKEVLKLLRKKPPYCVEVLSEKDFSPLKGVKLKLEAVLQGWREGQSGWEKITRITLIEGEDIFPKREPKKNTLRRHRHLNQNFEASMIPMNQWVHLADEENRFQRKTLKTGAIQLSQSDCLGLRYKISDRSAKLVAELCPESLMEESLCSKHILRYINTSDMDKEQCISWENGIRKSGSYFVKFTLKPTRYEQENTPKVSVFLEGSKDCSTCKK